MYSTCIHCQRDLGRNALIEHLPIGRRIAFDAAAGRLWVICAACARWNLVPFVLRWEAIEAGEKLYRDATSRMSTGEIGLAKTREGTDLVRIGTPLRPEMAAWRYGASFLSRRWTYAKTMGPVMLLMAAAQGVGIFRDTLGLAMIPGIFLPYLAGYLHHRYVGGRTYARIPVASDVAYLTRYLVKQVVVNPATDGAVELWMPIMQGRVEDVSLVRGAMNGVTLLARSLRDRNAIPMANALLPKHFTRVGQHEHSRVLRQVLPLLHESGARSAVVREAVGHLDAGHTDVRSLLYAGRSTWNIEPTALENIYRPRRLALEMLVHEDSERRWLAGELLELEAEWRRANDMASIADALLRDPAIEAKLEALRATQPVSDA